MVINGKSKAGLTEHISTAVMMATLLFAGWVKAAEFETPIPMRDGGGATYYVKAHLEGAGEADFMVDTGSGYLTLNEETLAALREAGRARYLHDLRAVLADGSELTMPVYRVDSLSIGGLCELRDVEAAVFPGSTRQILGLSALKKAAPFIVSFDPPSLILSHCPTGGRVAAVADR